MINLMNRYRLAVRLAFLLYVCGATAAGLMALSHEDSAAYPFLVMASLPFGLFAGGLSWNIDFAVRQALGSGLSSEGQFALAAVPVVLCLAAALLNAVLFIGMAQAVMGIRRRLVGFATDSQRA